MSEQSPYAAAARVPLIKSPSLRVPQATELPPDIHPLPDSVTAYFVYPFTLESQVVAAESARRSSMAAEAARHERYLRDREEEKQRRKREALRRVAPGFDPSAVLVPTKTGQSQGPPISADPAPTTGHQRTRSVMDDLVDHLAQMDAEADRASGI
ncbi:hypothetical protein BD626DRAFT_545769 [Schizophyllum amplum]|uniref:Uncharacterized protein n=1 Tax=Schizophyllum amplum TaxID=97359 RepID=A0A550CP87_9AGAR|nr:hypothetical protein BD626DRAFT_545769 [Auriculariopsis ampla]